MCSVWRPSRGSLPELQVRSDILVQGPRLEEAVAVFLDVVLTSVEDVAEVPVYFVDGLVIQDPPSYHVTGGGHFIDSIVDCLRTHVRDTGPAQLPCHRWGTLTASNLAMNNIN